MKTPLYRLAQVNIAKARAELDDPIMAGFVNQLPAINALADSSPGFVWRLQSESGDSTYLRPYDDPLIIFNLSVWDSVEALRQYVYRSEHANAVRDRKLWFSKLEQAYYALWWIPAGHLPSVDEAKERLAHRERFGDSAVAFSFPHLYAMPNLAEIYAEESPLPAAAEINYEGRVFALESRSELGDCGPQTLFRYRQHEARVWATYAGDGVRFGSLVASTDAHGRLRGCYQHLNKDNEVRTGRYVAIAESSPDSGVVMREQWHTDRGDGYSILREVH